MDAHRMSRVSTRTSDSRPFVFNNISGCTFIFEEQESGVRSQESDRRTNRTSGFRLRTIFVCFHTHSGLERRKSVGCRAGTARIDGFGF